MTKQYASSVYSHKSSASAKSARSFLSLSIPIRFSNKDINDNTSNSILPQFLKGWKSNKKKNDSDSITTRSSTSSSINRLKKFIFLKKKNPPLIIDDNTSSPRLSLEEATSSSSSSSLTNIFPITKSANQPTGILINRGEDSAEAIAERKRRRHQRRENILRLQKQKNIRFHIDNNESIESSSSDTLLTDDGTINSAYFDKLPEDWEGYNPRIMFIDPSPVPRFRNVAPPPPPSPPYLNVLIDTPDNDLHSIIKSPAKDEDEPTIYTSRESMTAKKEPEKEPAFLDEHEHQMSRLIETLKLKPPSKLRLDFYPPFVRGQTLKFSLQNTIPEDHIILFKFLTSNANYTKGQPERYFIRPSAGKMASTDQTEIFLFLNQIPTEVPLSEETGNLIKDKIMIRWAVIQRNTQIETWVNKLQESTRRRWIDMLDEEWPDQVTIRMTRIKIRFHV